MFKYLHLVGIHQKTNSIVYLKTYVVDSAIFMNSEMILELKRLIKGVTGDDETTEDIVCEFRDRGSYTLNQVRYLLVDSTNFS